MKAIQIVKPNQLEVIEIENPVIDEKNNVLFCEFYFLFFTCRK